jgi:hypothetical protein
MTWRPRVLLLAATCMCFLASGCGLRVPDIKEIWDGPEGTEQIEFEIKKRVYCDLKDAVFEAEQTPYFVEDRTTGRTTRKQIIPDDWGAQVSLLLQVDESTALNPGVAFTEPWQNAIVHFANGNITSPQSFSLSAGATLSSTATRIDKFDPYYTIAFLKIPQTKESVCIPGNDPFVKNNETPASSSPLIQSELGISKWLAEAMFTQALLHSVGSGSAPDTVSLEIKFIIVSSGNVNPAWKLVRVTANNGSAPLFMTGRTRTHDLIITIGPANQKTLNTHLASQIGQAVSGGNQSLLQPLGQ